MKTFVSAILVVGDSKEFLSRTLDAISSQPIAELLIVDTSIVPTNTNYKLAGPFDVKLLTAPGASYAESLRIAAIEVDQRTQWLWLLHDDSAPLQNSLVELASVADASPSAAVIGAKQVDWNNPRIIRQLGLTLTNRGNLFTLVTGELDQSQHDAASDVLAVGTAGALIRRDVFAELDGLDETMPPLAADIDFSMRARLAGYRVLVAPHARVAHVLRSLSGPKIELRKAEIQLQLSYLPLAFALAYWFGLPFTTVVRLIWRLATKRLDRLGSEFLAGLWGYFTAIARMRARRKVSRSGRAAIRALYATRQQVRDDRMRDIEQDEIEARVEAHAQLASRDGEDGSPSTAQLLLGHANTAKSFVAGGGLWFIAALLALSFRFLPVDEAISGGATIPLSQNWLALFARAGASWHPIGHGFVAPADPFVWVLTLFGAFTFWAPSLSITIFFFLASSLAFFAAYKAVSVFSRRAWVRNLSALSYVIWPTLSVAQHELRITSLISIVFAPFVVYALARVALLGVEISVRTKAQTWTWVALSGLSIAIVAAATPNTIPIILVALLIVLLLRPRRFGYLIWTGLPLAAIFAPFVFYLTVGILHPLAIFADPGVGVPTPANSALSYLLGNPADSFSFGRYAVAATGMLVLAVLALLSRASAKVAALLGFGGLAVVLAWVFAHIQFVAIGIGSAGANYVNGDPLALLGIAALAISCALAVWLDSLLRKDFTRILAVAVSALLAAGATGIALSTTTATWSSARVMPALIDAQAKAGSRAEVLIITKQLGRYTGQWIPVSGVQLEDLSVAYRYALSKIETESKSYASVAGLVAELVSGTDPAAGLLDQNNIGYVLVPNPNAATSMQISASLDQLASLESAGLTEYGKVWRVRNSNAKGEVVSKGYWSVTKVIQLSILIGFILLAIPTSGRRRVATGSEIFIDGTDEVANA